MDGTGQSSTLRRHKGTCRSPDPSDAANYRESVVRPDAPDAPLSAGRVKPCDDQMRGGEVTGAT